MKNFGRKALSLLLVLSMVFSLGISAFAADDNLYFDNKLQITGHTSWKQPDGITDGTAWTRAKAKQQHLLTFECVNTSRTMLLSLHYHVTGGTGTYKFNSDAAVTWAKDSEGDVVNVEMVQGDKVIITAKANAAVELTNITFVEKPSDTNVTFAPADHGTFTVGGTTIAQEETLPPDNEKLYSLSAEPDEGYLFAFWYDLTDAAVLSDEANTSLELENGHTVTAVFTEDLAEEDTFFTVNDFPFASYEDALTFAEAYGLDTIVLVQDFTIEQDIEVPAGITLLVPYNNLHTCFKDNIWAFDVNNTTRVDPRVNQNYSTPYAFKTLTIASGVTVTVNGELSVSAQHTAPSGTDPKGGPTGPCGFMNLQAGSEVVVNGGFYAFGYVVGDGNVTVNSGAQVFEVMQIADFRGGSASLGAYGNGVFPFSQYYVQNVEAPMTLNAGATEYVVASLSVTFQSVKVLPSVKVEFIGENGMFRMTDGSLTKTYLGDSDRLQIDVDGDGAIKSMQLSLAGMPIDSATVPLPINNNITINVLSGETEMGQSIALLPGAKISVAEGAKVVLTENTGTYVAVIDDEEVTLPLSNAIFVYDRETWMGGNYILKNRHFAPIAYAPGMEYTRTDADLVDAEIDVNGTIEIADGFYTTTGGSQIISSNGTGSIRYLTDVLTGDDLPTGTPQYKNSEEAVQLPIVPAQLTNLDTADEPYTSTAGAVAGDAFYWINDLGKWFKGFVITFDANGGEGTMDPMYVSSDNPEVPLPANTFTKPGFKFYGWSATTSMDDTLYEDGDTFYGNEYGEYCDITLYAIWEESSEVTVTFDANAVDAEGSTDPITVAADEELTIPACGFTRSGYKFVGWNDKPDATDGLQPGDPFASGEDVTLYAIWAPNTYTVTFNANGGVGNMDPQTITVDEATALNPNQFTREGYGFLGWTEDPEGTEYLFEDKALITFDEDLTLYAQWQPNTYTVTFVNEDGTELSQFTIEYGVAPEYNGAEPAKDATAQYTYAFSGWKDENGTFYAKNGALPAATGDATYTAQFTESVNTYTVIWKNYDGTVLETDENVPYGTIPNFDGEAPVREPDAANVYAFDKWDNDPAAVTGNITYTALFTASPRLYVVRFLNNDGTELQSSEVAYGETPEYTGETPTKTYSADDACGTNTFAGWTPEIVPVTGDVTYTATYTFTGWRSGWRYYVDDEMQTGWLELDGDLYYLDPETGISSSGFREIDGKEYYFHDYHFGYAAIGLSYIWEFSYEEEVPYAVFDENGVWQKNGPCVDCNTGDIYLVKDGIVQAFPGLYMTENHEYYYFGEDNKAVRGEVKWVEKNHADPNDPTDRGMLPKWDYDFGDDGIIKHEDVSLNGVIETEPGVWYYYIDGIRVHYGMFEKDGGYYYANSKGRLITDRAYWCTDNYGLMKEGSYSFDETGRMIEVVPPPSKNGIVDEDGSKFYYVDGVRTYAGLIEIDGSYYYVRTNGEVVHGRSYWITKTNDLIFRKAYEFDEDGKMIPDLPFNGEGKNGIVEEMGSLWYFVDGKLTGAGLIEIDGNYYYAMEFRGKGDRYGEIIHGRSVKVIATNGLPISVDVYSFADDGRMIMPATEKNGIIPEDGSLWYYVKGVRTYVGLIEIDGSYYYVKTGGEVVHGRSYWITKTNGLMEEKAYDFADDGKMIMPDVEKNGIVEEDGSLWYYVKGVRTYVGLIEIDGSYYYVRTSGEVVHGRSYWITKTNNLLPEKAYTFDDSGKMVNP